MGPIFRYNLLLILVLFSFISMKEVLSVRVVVEDGECSTSSSNVKTTYIRYGKKTCPNTAELAYEGRVAGSKYNDDGGGMNYLCLPINPVYEAVREGRGPYNAQIYGTEYTGLSHAPTSYRDYSSLNKHKVPCAVCLARSRSTTLTVPARNDCPSSEWTKEYSGYLMAERTTTDGRHRTEFVCVDKDLESADGNAITEWGSDIFFAEALCNAGGSLPCGSDEYVDGYELTCAVCSI